MGSDKPKRRVSVKDCPGVYYRVDAHGRRRYEIYGVEPSFEDEHSPRPLLLKPRAFRQLAAPPLDVDDRRPAVHRLLGLWRA